MHIDYLVQMANDIGAFFANEPDQGVAADNIQQHIKRYWEPRMRASIVAYYKETGGVELEGPVRTAIQRLAEQTSAKT